MKSDGTGVSATKDIHPTAHRKVAASVGCGCLMTRKLFDQPTAVNQNELFIYMYLSRFLLREFREAPFCHVDLNIMMVLENTSCSDLEQCPPTGFPALSALLSYKRWTTSHDS
jgi:hypothetical protein